MKMTELLDSAPENLAIVDALGKCHYQVKTHQKIMCSVSGGSDSDVMLDLIIRCGGKDKTTFVKKLLKKYTNCEIITCPISIGMSFLPGLTGESAGKSPKSGKFSWTLRLRFQESAVM
jgi:3'-phosphoadenosine 5'-phosphosulfate sulfotransferase (PAPS reductase)/FAD synthetase